MGLTDIVLLAVVQGLTEFLPVSSSGHLVICAAVLKAAGRQPPTDQVAVNIVLHVGTLLSVIVYYRRRVARLLGEDRRVIPLLMVGTVPAVLVGLPLKKYASHWLSDPMLAGCMLPVTGLMLLWAARRAPEAGMYRQLSAKQSFGIGVFQALAILPGISRSGATITAGLGAGLNREQSVTFAFLLAIPAISGAGVLETVDLVAGRIDSSVPVGSLVVGALLSFGVGLFALWWLSTWIERGRLVLFAYWCFAVGAAAVAWQVGSMEAALEN